MKQIPLPRFRFISGFVIASLLFGVGAVAVNLNNTPEGGYLLCANKKTRAVTFPGTLKCPSGTVEIQVPGTNSHIALPEDNSSSSGNSGTSNNSSKGKGTPNCNWSYLQKNMDQLSKILELCSSTQFNGLLTDINKQQNDLQNSIRIEKDKLAQLQKLATDKANLAKTLTGEGADAAKASAQDAQAAVADQAAKIAALTASAQAQITVLTNLVLVIQKKVKA